MTDSRAAELHRRALVADAHNDLLCAVATRPVARWASFFREQRLLRSELGGVQRG